MSQLEQKSDIILQAVALEYFVTVEQIKSKSRAFEYTRPRMVAIWLLYHYFEYMGPGAIGKVVNRSHSSAITSKGKIDHLLQYTIDGYEKVVKLKGILNIKLQS